MKDIDQDFRNAKDKAILFLGRFASLGIDEIKLFLDKFSIRFTDTLDKDVVMVVESTLLSPLEEEIATDAYKQKIPIYNSDQFDKLYAKQLNTNSILMSLKLSNNQERLTKLLHNQHIDDALFIKLFAMYDWHDEGMFDNSENMKVSTLFAKRFFSKSRFDAATYHSPISIFEVAILTKNPDLLEMMFNLPLIDVKQSKSGIKKPINTKEAIAANIYTNEKTLTRLFRLNDPSIDYFLAQNPSTPHPLQEKIFQRGDDQIKEALCQNKNLEPSLFAKLINFEKLWEYQPIDDEKLKLIPSPMPIKIGENENLTSSVIETLIESADDNLLENLAQNPTLQKHHIQNLYHKKNNKLYPSLCANPNTPIEILKELFSHDDHQTNCSLALNENTPEDILEVLFSKDDFEINKHLALNEALPISWLQQLQIDTRLLNYLKENKTFTENILHTLGI